MLSKNAQKIQEILLNKGLQLKVVEVPASTRTAQEAAIAIGCSVSQIIKSLVFYTKNINKPILILVSGVNRVDEKIVAQQLGQEIIKADAKYTKAMTGFAIGGVPPIGHIQTLDTFIDEDLLKYDELWAAAGTPHAVFKLSQRDLLALTNGTIIKIT